MEDWAPDAARAIELCRKWAAAVRAEVDVELYLLGSAIYADGEQFDGLVSDIDVIALMPKGQDAAERTAVVSALRLHKAKLELDMIPTLRRIVCDEPGVSLVPVTPIEVRANVHKSGARRFFDKNFYLDLATGKTELGLPDAGSVVLPDENRAALEYVQKLRNAFLGQAANGSGGLSSYRGTDPMPKALLRHAAQLDRDVADGEWYDTRLGLEVMFDALRERKAKEPWKDLFRRVSVARGGRGRERPLSDRDQLFLAELLHDLAASVEEDEVVLWEVRVGITAPTPGDVARLVAAIRAVAPEATLVSSRLGSVVLRFRSPARRLDAILLLMRAGALAVLLEAEDVEVRIVGRADAGLEAFEVHDRETRLREAIERWRPTFGREAEGIGQLAEHISTSMREGLIPQGAVALEAARTFGSRGFRLDLAVSWTGGGVVETIGVELIRLQSVSQFLSTIERLLDLPVRVLVVVVGSEERLSRIDGTAERFNLLGGNVSVIRLRDQKDEG